MCMNTVGRENHLYKNKMQKSGTGAIDGYLTLNESDPLAFF